MALNHNRPIPFLVPRPGFEPTTSWGLHFLTVVFNKNVAQSVERRALGTLEMALNQKIDLKKKILRSYLRPHWPYLQESTQFFLKKYLFVMKTAIIQNFSGQPQP